MPNVPDTRCNGWTNYATWRVSLEMCVSLEMFDGLTIADLTGTDDLAEFLSLYVSVPVAEQTLAEMLREQAEEMVEATSTEGIARDYAFAFLSQVDWREIASHKINNRMAEELAEYR